MGKLTIIGTGLEVGQLTLEAVDALKSGAGIILHTERIGCAEWLRENGIEYISLDHLYEECTDFDIHASKAAEYVIGAAADRDIVYGVYDIRDRSVQMILKACKKVKVIAGPSMEGPLTGYSDGAVKMLEASDWENYRLSASENALIREIDSRQLASEVKLKLTECYPEENIVYLLSGDGSIARLPLYDIDRLKKYDHRTCLLVPAVRDITALERYGFDDLVHIMEILQAPDGCSWDRAQTHSSLRTCLLEEAYEVIEAIDHDDPEHLYDELGDLLMNIVMQAVIAKKHGEFDISDSLTAICQKMIKRHTHIFGKDSAGDPEAVMDLWTKNKMKERGQDSYTQVLREVSKALPALTRAEKIIRKSAGSGIEWNDPIEDVEASYSAFTESPAESTLGDVLLSVCRAAQLNGIDAEIALNNSSDRYIDAFEQAEENLKNSVNC